MGISDAAIRAYRKAIDIYPTHAEAIAHIGYLYATQKNELDKGIRFIQLAIKYQADNEYFNLLLAELYRKAGHPAKTKLLMEQFYIERGELIKDQLCFKENWQPLFYRCSLFSNLIIKMFQGDEEMKLKIDEVKLKRRVQVGDFRIDDDEKKAILEVIEGGRISEWRKVKEFEKIFAKYIGTKYCLAVSSGTAALLVGLLALLYDERFPKVKKGAKIITSPVTYISTVNAIVLSGFEPVFVDIDKRTFKLNVNQIENILTKENSADYAGIIPVHLMGYPNDMDEINTIADKYDLFVFEDSAQAHGTIYNGKKVGSLSLLAAFSFYVAHNIQAGEMGCITTNDEKLFKLMTQLKANGRICDCFICKRNEGGCTGVVKYGDNAEEDYDPRFTHEYISYNFKITEFVASLGLSQVKKASLIFKKRQDNVRYLNQYLKQYETIFYFPFYDENISYLAYPLIIKEDCKIKRKWLREKLEKEGIETRPLFGCIPTQQPAYSHLRTKYEGKLPNAEYIGLNAFYTGCHQYLEEEDLGYIIETFNKIIKPLLG